MYNVIIAEDSKPILRHIRMLIESSGLPVRVTATAPNGLEALERLQDGQADILLTDIRMPKLDGLGLIEQAKALNPRLQAVLITGYSDFDYARRALNLHAFDYLLKPVDQTQLSDVLERLITQLAEQRHSDRKLLESVVEPAFLADMPLDAGLLAGRYRMALLRRRPFAAQAERAWTAGEIEAALSALPGGECRYVWPAPRQGRFVVLLAEQELAADGKAAARQLTQALQGSLAAAGLPAVVAVAPEPAGLGALAAVHAALERELRGHLTVGGNLAPPISAEGDYAAPPQAGEASKLALREPLKRGGEELFERLDRYLRQNLYAQLSVTEAAQQFHVSPSYVSRLVKRYTGSTFVHHYMALKIAEARRLLSSGPEVKVKHVAEALGFGDPHYFSNVFKEYVGCRPSEFKDK